MHASVFNDHQLLRVRSFVTDTHAVLLSDRVGANAGRQQSGSLTGAYAAAAAGPSTQSAQQREAAQDDQENMAPAAAAAALRPPPLGFVPQSTVTPAAALKQPG